MIIRECIVLLVGVAIALLAAQFVNAGRDIAPQAVFLPMLFCLLRAVMIREPDAHLSWLARLGFKLALGLALLSLFAFEMCIAVLAADPNTPPVLWAIVACFGAGYLALFWFAHRIVAPHTHIPREYIP